MMITMMMMMTTMMMMMMMITAMMMMMMTTTMMMMMMMMITMMIMITIMMMMIACDRLTSSFCCANPRPLLIPSKTRLQLWILESFNDNRRRKATTVLRDYLECKPAKGGGSSSSSRRHRGPDDGDSPHRHGEGGVISKPEFVAARPSDLAVEMLREPMVKTQAAILSRQGHASCSSSPSPK